LDGLIGAVGTASTYQAMEHQDEAFWRLFDDYRVFAVFDEIHHCSGYDPLLSNAWGQQILLKMQDRAAFTLALSGTPWRSDDRGIALARYSNPEGRLICDYRYGLKEAISDGVCRSPRIVLLDNQMLSLKEDSAIDSTVKLFSSIAKLLRESPVSYEDLVCHEDALNQLLDLGSKKLDEVRMHKPNAAGLVVATNIEHAHQIALALKDKGESFQVVTTRTPDAQHVINGFKNSDCRWIVAVGMISEGTDIPRLQVCCYLSRIRTELHYRQVLGRVLRRMGEIDDQAWLFVLAEPRLKRFSQRIADDLPDDLAVVCVVSASEFHPCSIEGEWDSSAQTLPGETGSSTPPTTVQKSSSQVVLDPMSTYQISFSKDYRQQLLAVF
jgi:superfamily II DNA or RNA helicase